MHSDAVREALDQASASLLAAIARGSGPSSGVGRTATAAQRRAEQAKLKHSPLSILSGADEYLDELSKHREEDPAGAALPGSGGAKPTALVRRPLGSPSSCTTKTSEGEGEAPEVGRSLSLPELDDWRRKAPTVETDDDEQVSIAGTSRYVDVPEWLAGVTPLTSPLRSRSA
mmetsp:Transcript_24273/g.61864  ORF Transcript_24273/g.61864 Transcript_24273/m.61864 type:complete len:172 (-) Transcript_24273:166-681(-)